MKTIVNSIEIKPKEKGLYSIYVNGSLMCIASPKYATECIKEVLFNCEDEE